ncbi:MAG: electron transport complex subunit E [Butyrivibrio sp.]|nr:electron transport complex subunit E [Butyrivibrio sp.]
MKKGALGLRADTPGERFFNGLIEENPTLVLMIGMCPTLAVTTSAINGLSMGLATTFVLALSNAVISALRKVIPDTVRIPSFIVVIASFVTLVQLIMQAYLPALNKALGVYIPLIVVNCIIFGRAEAYASKHGIVPSFFDGLGMGLGFTCAITIIGFFRELIGGGTMFDIQILGEGTVLPGAIGAFFGRYQPVRIFIQQAGAFLVLAFLIAIMNQVKFNLEKKGKDTSKFGSGGCCNDIELKDPKTVKEQLLAKESKGAQG